MKKNLLKIFILPILCFLPFQMFGSEPTVSTAFDKWCKEHYWKTEIITSTTFRQNSATNFVTFIGSTVELVKRLILNVSYMNALRLYREDGARSYAIGHGMSGSLGYRLLGQTDKDGYGLDIRCRYGHTIGNCSQQFALYDVGLETCPLNKKSCMMYGIGYRYVDYKTPGFKNISMLYLSIGTSF